MGFAASLALLIHALLPIALAGASCPTPLSVTVTTSDPFFCCCADNLWAARVSYTGVTCGNGESILWQGASTVADDIRPPLTAGKCTFDWSHGNLYYAGSCGVAPSHSIGLQLPTNCSQSFPKEEYCLSMEKTTPAHWWVDM